jgi:hypothetical protein
MEDNVIDLKFFTEFMNHKENDKIEDEIKFFDLMLSGAHTHIEYSKDNYNIPEWVIFISDEGKEIDRARIFGDDAELAKYDTYKKIAELVHDKKLKIKESKNDTNN